MNTLALNAQSPQPTATQESSNVAASDTQSSSDSSPVDTFLTLFVAEIQNQDPTDPTDATEYIDQLSSMAQVAMMEEMSVQANTNAVLMSNIQVMALGNLVGDDIMVQTTALQVSDQTINGRATLDDACTTADLHFTDAAGDDYTVSLIPQGSSSVGPGQVDFSVNPRITVSRRAITTSRWSPTPGKKRCRLKSPAKWKMCASRSTAALRCSTLQASAKCRSP